MSKRDPLEVRAELDSVIEVNEVQQQFQGEQLKDVKILSEFLTSNNKMKLAQLEAMRDNMRGIQLEMGEKDLDINFLETRTTEVKHNINQCRVVIDREKMVRPHCLTFLARQRWMALTEPLPHIFRGNRKMSKMQTSLMPSGRSSKNTTSC